MLSFIILGLFLLRSLYQSREIRKQLKTGKKLVIKSNIMHQTRGWLYRLFTVAPSCVQQSFHLFPPKTPINLIVLLVYFSEILHLWSCKIDIICIHTCCSRSCRNWCCCAEKWVWCCAQETCGQVFPLYLALSVFQEAWFNSLVSILLAFVQQVLSKKSLLNMTHSTSQLCVGLF